MGGSGEGVEAVPNECTAPLAGRSEKVVEKLVGVQAGWSALCPLTPCFGAELEVSLSTEQEEKRLLREHVLSLEVRPSTRAPTLLQPAGPSARVTSDPCFPLLPVRRLPSRRRSPNYWRRSAR